MRFSILSRRVAVLLATVLVSGCTMIPRYQRPHPPLADRFGDDRAVTATPSSPLAYDIGWRDFFTDPRLQALISIAMRENRDMRQAAASVMEAQGQYDVQHAGLFPRIDADAGAMYQGPSDQAGLSFAPGLDAATGNQSPGTFRYYNGGIGFSSYEIDLFGRIRSLSRSAQEQVLMQQANMRALRISVVSQVADAYITWLGDRESLTLSEENLRLQGETLRLVRARLLHGDTNRGVVRQAETQVSADASYFAEARMKLKQDENLLSLLIGMPLPENLPPPRSLDEQTLMAAIPAGLPSDMLAHRPDIVAAEHDLLSANADIGAARAAFYPRITLTASNGLSSLQFHKLFTSAATTWGVSPELSIPLLNWGQNSGNLKAAKAHRGVKAAAYEKTIQTAFREVSDALAARAAYLEETDHLQDFIAAAADASHLADLRLRAGTDSYLAALASRRDLIEAREWSVMIRVARNQNLVTIYRALGGGWAEHLPAASTRPPNPAAKAA